MRWRHATRRLCLWLLWVALICFSLVMEWRVIPFLLQHRDTPLARVLLILLYSDHLPESFYKTDVAR
jgi:hypothetical protein